MSVSLFGGVTFCHKLLPAVQNHLCSLEEEGNGHGFPMSITVQVLEMLKPIDIYYRHYYQ